MDIYILALIANIVLAMGILIIIFLLKKLESLFLKYINFLIALTVGLLLWIVFIWFFPELIENWNDKISIFVLVGILMFLLLELFLHRHHCKELGDECNQKQYHSHHTNSILMSISTFVHNFVHWIVLFASFSVSIYFWLVTTISVFLHSIPQNIANFLLSMKNMKLVVIAVLWNIFGIIFLYPFKDFILENKLYILSFVAWWLLYIALTDMLPEFKKDVDTDIENYYKFIYFIFILLWILIVYLINILH